MKKKRHYKIILSPEAIALRQIRMSKGFSIREICRRLNKSESFLRHIETGRNDLPNRSVLDVLFDMYGITYKIFRHKVSEVREEQLKMGPRDELKSIIDKIPEEKLELLRSMLSALVNKN